MVTTEAVRLAVARMAESVRASGERVEVRVFDSPPWPSGGTSFGVTEDSGWCVRIEVEGESVDFGLPGGETSAEEMDEALAWLTDEYQHWLSETAFAWGQLRPVVVARLDDKPSMGSAPLGG